MITRIFIGLGLTLALYKGVGLGKETTGGSKEEIHSDTTSFALPPSSFTVGAAQLKAYLPLLRKQRVGLVVNQTSRLGQAHLVDTLKSLRVNLTAIFAPEHGFRGEAADGATITDGRDGRSGVSVRSLYGKTKKPTPEMLADVDVLVFDIQDVGTRFYTFISTLHYIMEAAAEQGKTVIVLDRPNPNGAVVDGPVLEPAHRSFVGLDPLPICHGLTAHLPPPRSANDGELHPRYALRPTRTAFAQLAHCAVGGTLPLRVLVRRHQRQRGPRH
jgi:hypothetical protein